MLTSSWFIPIMVLIIVIGVAYLVMSHKKETAVSRASLTEQLTQQHVQCPNCQRWKWQKPFESNREQVLADTPHAAAIHNQEPYTNRYRCPFCGHQWNEEFTL